MRGHPSVSAGPAAAWRMMKKKGAAPKLEPIMELGIEGLTYDAGDESDTFIDDGDDDDDEPAQPQPAISATVSIDDGADDPAPVAAVVVQDPEPVASSMGRICSGHRRSGESRTTRTSPSAAKRSPGHFVGRNALQ